MKYILYIITIWFITLFNSVPFSLEITRSGREQQYTRFSLTTSMEFTSFLCAIFSYAIYDIDGSLTHRPHCTVGTRLRAFDSTSDQHGHISTGIFTDRLRLQR